MITVKTSMPKYNRELGNLMKSEHSAAVSKAYIAEACCDIFRIANRNIDWKGGGLYIDKYQVIARLDTMLCELKQDFTHDALVKFAAEAAICLSSVIASYRCPICRDTQTVWDGQNENDCVCAKQEFKS